MKISVGISRKKTRFKGFLAVVKGGIMFALLPQINAFWGDGMEKAEKYIKETIKLKQKAVFFRKFDYMRRENLWGASGWGKRSRKKFLLIKE